MSEDHVHDFIVIGSGFGGSAAGLRLSERGHDVLMLEKGRAFAPQDFPRTNWDLRNWLWMPWLGLRGLWKMTFFRHVTILSGVGVGGGSLNYASTHPVPERAFFESGSWHGLADWERELAPHYDTAKRMLGVTRTPNTTPADEALGRIAAGRGRADAHRPTDVAIYFGRPGETVDDPYFGGEGPPRTGCIHCGGCMLGCRYGAKNSLDRNYLYLARNKGLKIRAQTEVIAVRPDHGGGYRVEAREGIGPLFRRRVSFRARRVVFAGGVLGTVDLLLRMKRDPRGLPRLSERLGHGIRTNSEALIGVISRRREPDHSKGVAIGSIFDVDERSSAEPVRFPDGAGFFRLLMAPHVRGGNVFVRLLALLWLCIRHPLRILRAYVVPNWARATSILLFMRVPEGSLRLRRGWFGLGSTVDEGKPPTADLPDATKLAGQLGDELDGPPFSLLTETFLNVPTTAHILGGCCMGQSADTGVIDADQRVYGYDGLYVMDGSAISANPGVNPSLTILAMSERALDRMAARDTTADPETGVTSGTGVAGG